MLHGKWVHIRMLHRSLTNLNFEFLVIVKNLSSYTKESKVRLNIHALIFERFSKNSYVRRGIIASRSYRYIYKSTYTKISFVIRNWTAIIHAITFYQPWPWPTLLPALFFIKTVRKNEIWGFWSAVCFIHIWFDVIPHLFTNTFLNTSSFYSVAFNFMIYEWKEKMSNYRDINKTIWGSA